MNVIFREPKANLLGKLYSETIYAHDYNSVISVIISVAVQDITSYDQNAPSNECSIVRPVVFPVQVHTDNYVRNYVNL